jgi:hypothetical protein
VALRGLESLESRQVLSGGPVVVDVNVNSTEWSAEYIDELEFRGLGTGGYSVSDGATLPWTNIDQIRIRFDEDVQVDESDLALFGVNEQSYGFSDFNYDFANLTAVWTIDGSIGNDRLSMLLELSRGTESSGYGLTGGTFEHNFNVLPGNVSRSGIHSRADYVLVAQADGASANDSNYDPLRDIDGSGSVDANDIAILIDEIDEELPTGNPTALNYPPYVGNFWGLLGADGVWTFTGQVTDPDNNPTGFTVNFGGVLSGSWASVNYDGSFLLRVDLGQSPQGVVTAQTYDGQSMSNVASFSF